MLHQPDGNASNDNDQIVQYGKANRNQCANTCSLCGFRLAVLPYQEQNQTHDGNTATQQSPAESTIVNHLGLIVLSNTTSGANNCLVMDLCAAILTVCHC